MYIRFSGCSSDRLSYLDWFGDGLSDRFDERSGLRNWLLVNRPGSRLLNGRLLVGFVRGRLLLRVSRLRWLGRGRQLLGVWPVDLVLLPRPDWIGRRLDSRRSGCRWFDLPAAPRLLPWRLRRLVLLARRLLLAWSGGRLGGPAAPMLLARWLMLLAWRLLLLTRWLVLLSRRLLLLARWLMLLARWLVLLARRLMLLAWSGGRLGGPAAPMLLARWLMLLAWWLMLLSRRLVLAWSGGRVSGSTAPVSGVFGIRPVILRPSIGLLVGRPLFRLGVVASLVVRRFIWLLRLSFSAPKKQRSQEHDEHADKGQSLPSAEQRSLDGPVDTPGEQGLRALSSRPHAGRSSELTEGSSPSYRLINLPKR